MRNEFFVGTESISMKFGTYLSKRVRFVEIEQLELPLEYPSGILISWLPYHLYRLSPSGFTEYPCDNGKHIS